ncbi:MAG: hypothetical protein P8X85_07745 [Desulfobacterales bacterium]
MENIHEETVIINLLKQTVESEGCKLTDIDLENSIIKVDGPDDVVANCARAVAEILD